MVATSRLITHHEVVCAELDGEAVLLRVDTGLYFGLDEVGSRIWKLLEQGASSDEICAVLLSEYDVDDEALRRDVYSFLDELETNGLTRRVGG